MARRRPYGHGPSAAKADPERQQRLRSARLIYEPMIRGKLVHQAVQQTAVGGDWSFPAIRMVVAELQPTGLPPIYAMSLSSLLLTTVGSYRNNFWRNGWKLVGYELQAGHLFLDLLWRTPEGLVADELKVGEGYKNGIPADDWNQVKEQRRQGTRTWGAEFLGVRLLPLLAPDMQRWVPAR